MKGHLLPFVWSHYRFLTFVIAKPWVAVNVDNFSSITVTPSPDWMVAPQVLPMGLIRAGVKHAL